MLTIPSCLHCLGLHTMPKITSSWWNECSSPSHSTWSRSPKWEHGAARLPARTEPYCSESTSLSSLSPPMMDLRGQRNIPSEFFILIFSTCLREAAAGKSSIGYMKCAFRCGLKYQNITSTQCIWCQIRPDLKNKYNHKLKKSTITTKLSTYGPILGTISNWILQQIKLLAE